ncbi:antibiotic biosynthesis monooxygenase [Francisella sp. 19X1-34]|uniref:putative quinol monooxygenase n=1 Tax=Francisella sp. 19X1-34 TaxID=3087177 RepID=UPI002E2EDFDB|nr:antibiotic biosynthesis monooxygenase [Francisella sp. 19X1-34]MED7789099.1 antibiotic biosynthesis monooxygenase [Francisella sp. 19X1-34]
MSEKIIVIVELDSKNGRNQELYELAKKLIDPINAELGCIHYELGYNDRGTVFEVMAFTDENSHKIHLESKHVQNFLAEIKDLDVEIKIEKFKACT